MSSNVSTKQVGVGAYLERERRERGISLAEISEKTRIRSYYLEKIESGSFDQLPSIPVGRGFVRSYAEYLGLDPNEAAQLYNRDVGCRSEDIDEHLSSKIIFSKRDPSEKPKNLLSPVLAVILFLLVSGGFLWYVRGKTERLGQLTGFRPSAVDSVASPSRELPTSTLEKVNTNDSVIKNAEATPSKNGTGKDPKEETALVGPPVDSPNRADTEPLTGGQENSAEKPDNGMVNASEAARRESPKVPARPASPAARLILKIKAVEDTWLRVVVDQEPPNEVFLTAGSEKIWPGNDRFTLTVGNAAGTQVFLNDAHVALPKTASNVIREFVVTNKVAELQPGFAGN